MFFSADNVVFVSFISFTVSVKDDEIKENIDSKENRQEVQEKV